MNLKESYNQRLSPFCLYKIWTSQQTNGKMHLYLQTPSPTKELRKTTCEMKIHNVQYRDKFKACPIFYFYSKSLTSQKQQQK